MARERSTTLQAVRRYSGATAGAARAPSLTPVDGGRRRSELTQLVTLPPCDSGRLGLIPTMGRLRSRPYKTADPGERDGSKAERLIAPLMADPLGVRGASGDTSGSGRFRPSNTVGRFWPFVVSARR